MGWGPGAVVVHGGVLLDVVGLGWLPLCGGGWGLERDQPWRATLALALALALLALLAGIDDC